MDQWLLYDGMRAQLLDPEFANGTVHFMELQVWVARSEGAVGGWERTAPCNA